MSLDDLDDALAAYEVHAGYPAQRRELAGKLFAAGTTTDDVVVLGDNLTAMQPRGAVPKILAAALLSDDLAQRLADLRRVEAARSKRTSPRFGDKPTAVAPLPGEDQAAWEWDRKCIIARSRVRSDRRTHREVAAELGVAEADLPAMIARGIEMAKPIDLPHKQAVVHVVQHPKRETPEKSRQCKIDELIAWARENAKDDPEFAKIARTHGRN